MEEAAPGGITQNKPNLLSSRGTIYPDWLRQFHLMYFIKTILPFSFYLSNYTAQTEQLKEIKCLAWISAISSLCF